ncbi:MAG: DUF1326 domain-containing protein [Bacteroidota bacterium]
MRTKHVVLAFVAFFALQSCAAEQPAWQITARALVTDNCPASACSCLMGGGPHHEYCRAVGVLHITDGNYGDVSLSGQNVALTTEFTSEATTYMAFYIDEAASDEVKEALRALLSAKPFGVVGDGFSIKETSIAFAYEEGKESSFSIGDLGTMTLTPMIGGDGKSQMKIVNPTYTFPAKEVYLSSAKGKYSDYGRELTLEHHSGEVSVFTLSGGGE